MPGMPTNLEAFESLLGTLRPRLHRYCARMTGSVIDGEDVVQDTLLNAYEARSTAGGIANVEAWLFRIAHNAAMDFLRRHARHGTAQLLEIDETIAAPGDVEQDREIAAASLHTFMRLAPPQRCAVKLAEQWRFEAAWVDGRPVMVVFDRNDPAGGPAYFVALDFGGDAVTGIRDFLFARYVLDGAALRTL
ncbi:RNA polymerase sigma factor [Paraburkholderia sp. CNPSo 3274]|uniref:RNA polymerase sigma factor n=1 Tax=Paraburkholderia sp. CNPSo 3274 TaxID=2940932 RepID=UPI0020B69D04|nr:RNA polymerase sigma factor [Paraburkholderia sp. CNPSo 3274]MCP3707237.1 RNA polymerase sigma factor [Paraburkholderia sp. CNPSo 3274]